MSLPALPLSTSVLGATDRDVVPTPAEEHVVAVAANQPSFPSPAVQRELDGAGCQTGSVPKVVTRQASDQQRIVGGLLASKRDAHGQTLIAIPAGLPPIDTTSSPLVPFTSTVSPWLSPVVPPRADARLRLTSVADVPVRSLTVIVSAPSRALKVDPLHPDDVRGDSGNVAKEPHALPIGRHIDRLVGPSAVDVQRVSTRLAFGRIVAVARIPSEHVIAAAHQPRRHRPDCQP